MVNTSWKQAVKIKKEQIPIGCKFSSAKLETDACRKAYGREPVWAYNLCET